MIAERDGYAATRRSDIELRARSESVVDPAIVLERPVSLDLVVEPAHDPWNEPWRIQLYAVQDPDEVRTLVAEKRVSEAGSIRQEGLAPGQFELRVVDGDSSTWLVRSIEVHASTGTLFVAVPLIPIRGVVLIGDEPISGTVWFGGKNREQKIKIATDDDGRFSGHLPREGPWAVDVSWDDVTRGARKVEVRRRPGQREAIVEIRFPDTELHGRVLDARGEEVRGATVLVLDEDRDRDGNRQRAAVVESDEEGQFAIRGLYPGQFFLQASTATADSDVVGHQLVEDLEGVDVVLRLEAGEEIHGIVTANGRPLAGVPVAIQSATNNPWGGRTMHRVSRFDGNWSP